MAYFVRKESARFNKETKAPYRLSRSRIDTFFKCPRCFWLEERFGVKKPDSYPLTLNIAVDALLKKEFDMHRMAHTPHPIMASYGIDAVPFEHENMDVWRHNFSGVEHVHTPTNLAIFGAVDDIWIDGSKKLHVVDYKATSKAAAPTLDGDLGAQYKRQMEVYQWLLRQNRFKVSDTGYFVYVNGKKNVETFGGKLEFDVSVLPCEGDASWIEPILLKIQQCLVQDEIPKQGAACEYCPYREAAGKTLLAAAKSAKKDTKEKRSSQNNDTSTTNTLF